MSNITQSAIQVGLPSQADFLQKKAREQFDTGVPFREEENPNWARHGARGESICFLRHVWLERYPRGYFMQLQTSISKRYALLASGILIVEPDPELLAARSRLLSACDFYVAASHQARPANGLQETDVRLAILSQSLGMAVVEKLAREIRHYYSNARILIFGLCSSLEDQLYDDSIRSDCRPDQLMDVLFRLNEHSAPRSQFPRARPGPPSLSLGGLGWVSLRRKPAESDPTKDPACFMAPSVPDRSVPADENSIHLV